MKKIKVEACTYNIESVISAKNAGADRVELCDNLYEGGTTPSLGTFNYAKKQVKIPVFPIIRPRGGDFLYTKAEFEVIKEDIKSFLSLGCDGIVSGFLNSDGSIDVNKTAEIVDLCNEIPFTFHRAFDLVKDPMLELEKLIDLGVTRVLTSGLKNTVLEGKETIKKLVDKAEDKIIILAGGGITAENVNEIINYTGVSEIHSSGKSCFISKMNYQNPEVKMYSEIKISEDQIINTDELKIKKLINKIH